MSEAGCQRVERDAVGDSRHTVSAAARDLATLVVPSSAPAGVGPVAVAAARRYALSRFAYLRRDGDELVLESPLGHAFVVLHDVGATALVGALARPRGVDELVAVVGGPGPEIVTALLGLLEGAAALAPAGPAGAAEEPDTAAWSFHDLLFHARSRAGRHRGRVGATYRLADRQRPAPPVKPPMSDDVVELARPDLDALVASDAPLAAVVEGRRSVRDHGAQPITLEQLGHFLFRTARVRRVADVEGPYVRTDRPYPSGGQAHELEIYLAVRACAGLAAGLYHYCPGRHVLERLAAPVPAVAALLEDARRAAGAAGAPQILVVLAARFARVTWKYESIAYALTLKHVGVLVQTMALTATAMGLAACALGTGSPDRFCQAAGTSYAVESSVGELMLGSLGGPP